MSQRILNFSNKEFRRIPYHDTDIKWTRTRGEIEGLIYELREEGIVKQHAWLVNEDGDEVLAMQIEVMISDNISKRIELKIIPPRIFVEKKSAGGRGPSRTVRAKNTEWRLFWWYFKAKTDAVRYGLNTLEEEFMSTIVRQLKDETEITLGQALKMILAPDVLALEDQRERKKVPSEVV